LTLIEPPFEAVVLSVLFTTERVKLGASCAREMRGKLATTKVRRMVLIPIFFKIPLAEVTLFMFYIFCIL